MNRSSTGVFLALLLHAVCGVELSIDTRNLQVGNVTSIGSISRRLTKVSAHDVQPLASDEVHAVWINGPSHSAQLSGKWPGLGTTTKSYAAGHSCDPTRPAYTGYHDSGAYCQLMDDHFDKNPHLVVHSGNVGMVLDASAAEDGNIVRQLGPVSKGQSTSDIYQNLTNANVCATLTLTCTNLTGIDFPLSLTARPLPKSHAEFGLVRQGHAVTHVDIRNLKWLLEDGNELQKPGCVEYANESTGPARDPSDQNCNQDFEGGNSVTCRDPEYPICKDFIQGQRWGKCYEKPSACHLPIPKPWLESTVWPDLVALHLHWDTKELNAAGYGCSGHVQFSVSQGTKIITKTGRLESTSSLAVLLTNEEGSSVLQESHMLPHNLDVTSIIGTILPRDSYQDVLVDIPKSIARCGYEPCDKEDMVDVSVGNPKDSPQTLRLSLTRNFPTFMDSAPLNRNHPGAEITGLNIIVMDASGAVPLGIPSHISKNWHVGKGDSYYAGYWWTCNVFLRLPPKAMVDLKFKIVYEKFGGISAFSHAQLSIVGYSNKWLWEQAALGTGGENFCMDPLGSHTRAPITDVRVKLFDGRWKSNVGGGDFLLYFDEKGAMQSKAGLDAQLHANGPCLSNATYTYTTMDGAIESKLQVSGGRTDDLVRMFLHVKYTVTRDTKFSRLAFFQMGSETYNYNSIFERFVFGAGEQVTHNFTRKCTGRTALYREKLYDRVMGIYREPLRANGPWWFAMAPTDGPTYDVTESPMVVGDRGLVVREFDARLQGQSVTSPALSVLCDKIELGPPKGISELMAGDFVEMKLEMVTLPRQGVDFDTALANSEGSRSLQILNGLPSTWERIQAQATHHIQVRDAVPEGAHVESQYPIRVCVPTFTDTVEFKVFGKALGFVPIVICGLSSSSVQAGQGLWSRMEGEEEYTLLADATVHRQTNFDREQGRYELIFNVEILNDDQCTIFAFIPTNDPTEVPTGLPSKSPTGVPTESPFVAPTSLPTNLPSSTPITQNPTAGPTGSPVGVPTVQPTAQPTASPSYPPTTLSPTRGPTGSPVVTPTFEPTGDPTRQPSNSPTTLHPTAGPTGSPVLTPTMEPTAEPTKSLSKSPATPNPTEGPTGSPVDTLTGMPTLHPTVSRIKTPATADPTAKPTSPPETFKTLQEAEASNPFRTGAVFGDPHIMLWNGTQYDFHGGCDLVLATAPVLANGLGMDIHIRSKIRTWWSFIHTAVIRIGKDTFEVQGGKDKNLYWINGKAGGEIKHGTTLEQTISGFPIHFRWTSGGQRQFRIDLLDGDAVFFKTYGEFLRVNVKAVTDEKFRGSLGLMGSYPEGNKVARDNRTIIVDNNQFGQEWQVLSHEPQLFHQANSVRHPRKCRMPRTNSADFARHQRRLLEGSLSRESAEEACAHAEKTFTEACVYDVLATGSKDLAGSY